MKRKVKAGRFVYTQEDLKDVDCQAFMRGLMVAERAVQEAMEYHAQRSCKGFGGGRPGK